MQAGTSTGCYGCRIGTKLVKHQCGLEEKMMGKEVKEMDDWKCDEQQSMGNS